MKSAMLRSIDVAFSRVDMAKLGSLAELSGMSEARFLVESVRRTYAQVSNELMKRKAAKLQADVQAKIDEGVLVGAPAGGLEDADAISIEEERSPAGVPGAARR